MAPRGGRAGVHSVSLWLRATILSQVSDGSLGGIFKRQDGIVRIRDH